VLAGGRSSRFGSDDKLGSVYAGVPLLHHAVLRLAEITGDVVVVLAPHAPEPALPPGARARFARDPREGEGPLAGAVAGLGAVDRELALLTGGDMPGLRAGVAREMLRVSGEDRGVDAVVLQDGERFRPLPAVVRTRTALDEGRALLESGERSLRAWLRAMRLAVIGEAAWTAIDPDRETLRDIDVPGDLAPP
jgi:molybdopterin-guanine dinucleotide biosynthesis protein A